MPGALAAAMDATGKPAVGEALGWLGHAALALPDVTDSPGRAEARGRRPHGVNCDAVRLVLSVRFVQTGNDMRQTLDLSDEQAAAIDRWRGKRSPIPSRAAAIRELLQTALTIDGASSPDGERDHQP